MARTVLPRTPALPVVAIVGRPNVGKSTLFNRIVGAKRAIVDDAPGVTRDRVMAPASYAGRPFLCVDTGGFLAEMPRDRTSVDAQVRAQALTAVEDADAIVCVLDGQAGLAPVDRQVVRLLARRAKPLFVAVNKADGPGRDALVHDFHALGVPELYAVSAAHNRGLDVLLDAVTRPFPTGEPVDDRQATRLALMGRPNVGKSSILNRILGSERTLVSARPGTTRDTIDTPIMVGSRPYVLIDTAGIRRRSRVEDSLEGHGAVRALGVLSRTDLVLVVLDAREGLTDQDARIVGRALTAGRATILLANKWDMVAGPDRDVRRFREGLRSAQPGFADLPILCVSATTGEGMDGLFGLVETVERRYRAVLATPALNRALKAATSAHTPPSPGGRPLRLFYATQTAASPPEVTVFTSSPGAVPPDYTRFLANRFTESFDLAGVPIRLRYRPRRTAQDAGPTRRRSLGTASRKRRSSTRSPASVRSRRR
jgi:GTP-binding protein